MSCEASIHQSLCFNYLNQRYNIKIDRTHYPGSLACAEEWPPFVLVVQQTLVL